MLELVVVVLTAPTYKLITTHDPPSILSAPPLSFHEPCHQHTIGVVMNTNNVPVWSLDYYSIITPQNPVLIIKAKPCFDYYTIITPQNPVY